MRRALLLLFTLMVSSVFSTKVYSFEPERTWGIEVGVGANCAFNRMFYDYTRMGLSGYLEGNYYAQGIPMSFGLHAQADGFSRESAQTIANSGVGSSFFSYRLMLTSNYYWSLNPTTTLFAGAGAGMAHCRRTEDFKYNEGVMSDTGNKYPFTFMPRIGVITRRVKYTLSYVYGDSANSFLCLHVGYMF